MKSKNLRIAGWLALLGTGIALVLFAIFWFKPHRDVQETDAYATIDVRNLVQEFSTDASKANAKYLSADGNSKVLIVEGRVSKISVNQNGEKIILLKDEDAKMGVSANFTREAGPRAASLKTGDRVKIKGAITAGNSYDPDLDLYEHAVLIDCSLIP